MYESVMSVLSDLSPFASISSYNNVIDVVVDDVILDEDCCEVVPDEFDDDVLQKVLKSLEAMAESVEYGEYSDDVFEFDGFKVRISYSSYDI